MSLDLYAIVDLANDFIVQAISLFD
jgi:hypothetical protein